MRETWIKWPIGWETILRPTFCEGNKAKVSDLSDKEF